MSTQSMVPRTASGRLETLACLRLLAELRKSGDTADAVPGQLVHQQKGSHDLQLSMRAEQGLTAGARFYDIVINEGHWVAVEPKQ